ncbi:hypothetical protein L198_05355 [Cryptococcus wingfieldii CBS 7118]|uniref:CoA-binding domain-containing protein n=1 Tax=Cryptococcus wingfieldii CBS 7118 TaxID=1295528 RepID=A0A1E3IXZ6_9TREE|nr:hypothetical protein L198_05355 [Cryptococcus wingfieldii CBS 7118]ODN93490.1 hypothetical protein L198_05355 [Cryptococcus wingfieldii CBS 7118]
MSSSDELEEMGPITPAMKRFLSAERYAVIGRVLDDRSRWDNKASGKLRDSVDYLLSDLERRYQARNYPVAAVRPDKPSKSIEGLDVLTDPASISTFRLTPADSPQLSIPSLPSTSVSIIIHPVKSLGILQSLFANPANAPHSVWFQPGADDGSIWKWVKEKGLEAKIVGHGACVLRDGDGVLDAIKSDGKAKI